MPGFAAHEFVRIGDSTREYDPGGEPLIGAPGGIWSPTLVGAAGIPGAGAGIGFAPVAPAATETEVASPLTASEVVLDKGTDVVDAAGDKIGTVAEVLFGPDDRITGFMVEQGFLFHHDVWVPAEWIGPITHEHVQLTVSRDQVEQSRR
jgi:hypothetical protein